MAAIPTHSRGVEEGFGVFEMRLKKLEAHQRVWQRALIADQEWQEANPE
jgi:hypothetical protein